MWQHCNFASVQVRQQTDKKYLYMPSGHTICACFFPVCGAPFSVKFVKLEAFEAQCTIAHSYNYLEMQSLLIILTSYPSNV